MPPNPLTSPVDFDLHGIVRVRVVDGSPTDVATVRRQLGLAEAPAVGEADITIRFADRLAVGSPMRLIGLDDAAFTDDAYLVLRSRHKTRVRVAVPMAEAGEPCEIVSERGAPAIPLLIALVNLRALVKGYVPVHASAARHRGVGILVTGWAKGGKTELLLGLMAAGADYVGDEWVYIAPDGRELLGIPEPMKIWASHLDAMPVYRRRIPAGELTRLRAIRTGSGTLSGAAEIGRPAALARGLRRVAYVADQQAYVHVPPARLFGAERCVLRGPLDRVVLALSAEGPDVHLEPASGAEVAARMTHSVAHERLDLVAHYRKFRFAFPELANGHLEEADARVAQLLTAALDGTPAAILTHPYPAPIPAMVDEVNAWLP